MNKKHTRLINRLHNEWHRLSRAMVAGGIFHPWASDRQDRVGAILNKLRGEIVGVSWNRPDGSVLITTIHVNRVWSW